MRMKPGMRAWPPEKRFAKQARQGRKLFGIDVKIVDDLEFLGAFYRATLSVEETDDLSVTADFAPGLVRDRDIREGADLLVVFPDDRIRVFANR